MDDRSLSYNTQHLYDILYALAKGIRSRVRNYVEILPAKARPIKDIQLFLTKPLPKPEGFYKNKQHIYHHLAKRRHTYNDKLIAAIRVFNISFINPGIQPSNSRAFVRIKKFGKEDHFTLTPDGLHQYWYAISTGLEKLHKGRKLRTQTGHSPPS